MHDAVRSEALPGPGRLQFYDVGIGLPIPLPLLRQHVPAGFPSPADDFVEAQIDLQQFILRSVRASREGRA